MEEEGILSYPNNRDWRMQRIHPAIDAFTNIRTEFISGTSAVTQVANRAQQ